MDTTENPDKKPDETPRESAAKPPIIPPKNHGIFGEEEPGDGGANPQKFAKPVEPMASWIQAWAAVVLVFIGICGVVVYW